MIIGRAARRSARSPTGDCVECSRPTRAPAATTLPRGPRPCWRPIAPSTSIAPLARVRCGGGCTRSATAGSARAIVMRIARPICRRKRGSPPSPESKRRPARRHPLHGLDAAATVPTAACRVGAGRHDHGSADNGAEREGRAVRGNQPGHRASRRRRAGPSGGSRRARVSPRVAPAVPRLGHPLAARRSGDGPHRSSDANTGRAPRYPLRLAADAGVRAKRDGPTVARVEGCDRREPTSADDRRAGRQRPALGVDAVADRSASQSRPVVAPFLAPRFVAKLLSTYLAICTQFRSVMCVIVVWMKFCVRSGVLNKSAIWDIPEICCKRSGNPLTYRVSVDVPSPDTSTF